jgi:hypothetical protein
VRQEEIAKAFGAPAGGEGVAGGNDGLQGGLLACPFCGTQAELPCGVTVFACPNPSCGRESCSRCREAAHVPLRCDEVERDAETEARRKVEEAMTSARVRTCPNPKCGKPFYKTEGCNKMACPDCATLSCYICKQRIAKQEGYAHFCQTPHCDHSSCGKCTLYSNDEEDDRELVRAAGLKTAAETQAALAAAGGGGGGGQGAGAGAASAGAAAQAGGKGKKRKGLDVDALLEAAPKRPAAAVLAERERGLAAVRRHYDQLGRAAAAQAAPRYGGGGGAGAGGGAFAHFAQMMGLPVGGGARAMHDAMMEDEDDADY